MHLPKLGLLVRWLIVVTVAFLVLSLGRTLWNKPDTSLQLVDLMSKFALPLALVAVVWLLFPLIQRIAEQRGFTVKVGAFEVTVQQFSKNLIEQIGDLQTKVAGLLKNYGELALPGGGEPEPPGGGEAEPPGGGGPEPPVAGGPAPGGGEPAPKGSEPAQPQGEGARPEQVYAPDDPLREGPTKPFAAVQRQILWVDDHPEMSALEIEKLKLDGLRVLEAKSTNDAIDMLARDRLELIDVVITTAGRREEGVVNWRAGLELVERMKREGINVPVVVYSHQLSASQQAELRKAGILVITSPVDLIAITSGRCASCGKVLIRAQFFSLTNRPRCPNCGSLLRRFTQRAGQQIGQIEMTREEVEALQKEATRLERLLQASDRFVRASAEPPVPNSPMDLAKKSDLRDAYDIAYLLLFSAEDHLRMIQIVLKEGPLPAFSLFTLLRAAADAIVRCRHLLDPTITETQRLARGLNERLDNLEQQRKAASDQQAAKQHYEERVAHLEERAIANGITPLRKTEAGPITAFGEPRKNVVDLFAAYFPGGTGSLAYRVLSGYVHSKPWITLPSHRAQASSEPGVALVATDLNVFLFVGVLGAILDVHDANIGYWLMLAGYPGEVWANAKKDSVR